jgi:uncharacterized protein (TIGR01777 family)
MRVLIGGGSGFLGRALTGALRADGHRVQSLTRRPKAPDDIEWSAKAHGAPWTRALAGADAVINLAGESIASGRWTAARKTAIRDSRLRATAALVEAIDSSGTPLVFLSGSAVGYYGLCGDEVLTEASPSGADFLALVCRDWEQAALQSTSASRIVLLRTGLVLAADGGALPQMALPFRFGAGGRLGSGQQFMSWIHLDDWIGLVWTALTSGMTGPLNLTAPQPLRNADFARALGRAMHRPALMPTPGLVLRFALGEMADALLLGGQRVVPAKALDSGYAFRYPTADAALQHIYSRS